MKFTYCTYILVDFLTVFFCFVFSFDRRIRFDRHFGAFLKSAVIVGIPFILWDVWFTAKGVWWFNDDYIIGLRLAGLPIEEWLFFICIPFACVFTWHALNKFFDLSWMSSFNNLIVFASCVVCVLAALLHHDRVYTLVTAIATTVTLIGLHFIFKAPWIGAALLVYLLLMPGFFAVNGVLTGTGLAAPVVNYNPDEFLNVRMLTIPIEDAVYGYSQFLLVIFFYEYFKREKKHMIYTRRYSGTLRV